MEETQNTDTPTPTDNELELLKKRADFLKIQYHPNIGIDKLRDKVQKTLSDADSTNTLPTTVENPVVETILQRNKRLRAEAGKLVRIRVSCMNPNKKEHSGEIITVSNAVVGTFKKYIPFNNEEGWHVPNIIYKHLLERKCQVFTTVIGPHGNKIKKGKLIKEFAIEVLPSLSVTELQDLATKQAVARTID